MGEQSKEAKALSGLQMMFQGIFSTMEHERLNRTITNGMIREAKSKMATALGKQYDMYNGGWDILVLEMRCNAWRIIIGKQLKALGKGASKAQMRQVFRSDSGLPPSPEKTNPRWESSEKFITKSFIAWCKLGRPTPLSLINELSSPKPANKPKHNSNKEQTLPGCDHIPIFLSPTELIDKYYVAEDETKPDLDPLDNLSIREFEIDEEEEKSNPERSIIEIIASDLQSKASKLVNGSKKPDIKPKLKSTKKRTLVDSLPPLNQDNTAAKGKYPVFKKVKGRIFLYCSGTMLFKTFVTPSPIDWSFTLKIGKVDGFEEEYASTIDGYNSMDPDRAFADAPCSDIGALRFTCSVKETENHYRLSNTPFALSLNHVEINRYTGRIKWKTWATHSDLKENKIWLSGDGTCSKVKRKF